MSRRLFVVATVVVVGLVVAVDPAVSLARFTSSRTPTGVFSTATLQPPTNVAGTGGTGASLTWTASTSSGATGYRLLRSSTSGSGYTQVKTVTPIAAVATTDAPGNGVWYYVLRSYVSSWTSALSNEATIAIGPQATGYRNCTSNGAETANAGDNNGYETTPGNACVNDGAYATDASSGTNTSTSCSNAGKDKHRFWGYAFGMPGSVSAITGITVQARAGTNNASGTYGMCVELSWDAGLTWTTGVPVTFGTSAQTTYTFGGTTNTWGRTWAIDNLSTANFRVRVSDAASVTNKTFNLDWLRVSVNYTP